MSGVAIEIAAMHSIDPEAVDPKRFPPANSYFGASGKFGMRDVISFRAAGWVIPTTYEEEVDRRRNLQREAP